MMDQIDQILNQIATMAQTWGADEDSGAVIQQLRLQEIADLAGGDWTHDERQILSLVDRLYRVYFDQRTAPEHYRERVETALSELMIGWDTFKV